MTIDCNILMRRALQRMIGDVLAEVAENGLSGEHHFYISFQTHMKGVSIPAHLKAQYPEEMTIVLQEWFDDLGIMDDRFCVTLSFSGKAENLVIPFEAVTGFADPSVNFNLRFEAGDDVDIGVEDEEEADGAEIDGENKPEIAKDKALDGQAAQVIQFDRFRKGE